MELDEVEKTIQDKLDKGEQLTEEEKAKGPPPLMPYKDRERFYGTGPLRIGKPFTFKEDIYSLLFIANVRREYKDQCVQEAFERVKCIDLMIQEYR